MRNFKLDGVLVEVDETLIGGSKHGSKRGRGTSKAIVVIAIEIKEPKGYGRIWMRHIPMHQEPISSHLHVVR